MSKELLAAKEEPTLQLLRCKVAGVNGVLLQATKNKIILLKIHVVVQVRIVPTKNI